MTPEFASRSFMIIRSSMIIFGMVVGMSISTNAETVKVMDEASTDGSFTIAQTNGQDRRDTRQDCRQGKGPSARTSATANSRDARSSRGTAARGVSTSSGCGALPPARRSGHAGSLGDEADKPLADREHHKLIKTAYAAILPQFVADARRRPIRRLDLGALPARRDHWLCIVDTCLPLSGSASRSANAYLAQPTQQHISGWAQLQGRLANP